MMNIGGELRHVFTYFDRLWNQCKEHQENDRQMFDAAGIDAEEMKIAASCKEG